MADNITAFGNTGTGTDVLATDEIGGVHYQRTKVVIGGDGVNDGDVSAANPLPVSGPLTDAQLRAAAIDVDVIGVVAEDTPHASGDRGLPIFALRWASDAPTAGADGDYTLLKLDEEGRLKVATKPASYADITGDITAVQATIGTPVAGGTVAGDVSRASNVMMFCTGTFSTINCTFEGSLEATGDANWFGVQAVRTNANTIETATGNLSAQPAYAWELSVNGLKRVRVRCTARTSGTQSWRFVLGTYATEPIPAAQISGTQPVSGTVAATVAAATLGFPTLVADVGSAALTTTTTTGTLTPTAGTAYEVMIPVTAVSGTNPTLDVVVQESDDGGTNWFDVFHFPRITATGVYRSPKMMLLGNRVRYVQTVGGTTPSFTRAINRLQSQDSAPAFRQLFDRTLAATQTLNAVTASLNVQNTRAASLTIVSGAITTTAPALQLEGTDDGVNWYAIGSPLTAVANSTVRLLVPDNNSQAIRARVSTAGSGATLTHVILKGF